MEKSCTKDTIILIPARLKAKRLPNKPLIAFKNLPMIVHVASRAREATIGEVHIACCGTEIAKIAKKYQHQTIITPTDLPSGTDRIHYALQQIPNSESIKFIVNLQGDMPFIDPSIIINTLNALKQNPEADIATAVSKKCTSEEQINPNVVKATLKTPSKNGENAYVKNFTRTPQLNAYKHIGIYVYRRPILEKFVKLPMAKKEIEEGLEQLRAISAGMKFIANICNKGVISVDSQNDIDHIQHQCQKN